VNARAFKRGATVATLTALLVLASGCATVPGAPRLSKEDPWENFNRKVFNFNEALDETVLKPVANAYRAVVPQLVRTGVSNVLGNIGDLWSAVNHLLQGKIHTGLDMGARVMANTTLGLGGLLDPATEMGLTRQSEDFGQTLGRWGVGPGPYLVLPLIGPSTLRDSSALVVDRQASASNLANNSNGAYAITALEVVSVRASLLEAKQLLDAAALDKYTFMRQAYLARRLDAVYDGSPPLQPFDDEEDAVSAASPPASAASGAAPAKPKADPK
jgi:phospholipid-binding lipoprotein MlaA